MGRKLWKINTYDKKAASVLASRLGTDDFAVLLLQSRGIKTEKDVSDFLTAADGELSSPFLLADMQKAVERIKYAVENGEQIHVFGDYDADGVTATALLVSYLEAVGAEVSHSIPSRLEDGYGLSPDIAKKIANGGTKLVITVDNGISSFEEAEIFKKNGIDFIITDHHKVGDTLPDAFAVINPHRADDFSPEENLAGVGVALKLVAAMEDGDYSSVLDDFGDIAAIGTIADIVPLTGENRIIVAKGIDCIKNTYRLGLEKLISKIGMKSEINASSVAFGIAPRINAAGRIADAETAVRLLLTDDEYEAEDTVDRLMSYNVQRQSVETAIFAEIEDYFNANPERRNDAVLVVYGENWHPGVIGIAAARLVEKYGSPALVISSGADSIARGSGRSIDGLSLYDALSYCSDCLVRFGGHTLAAGFSVKKENIDIFRRKINEYAASLSPFFPSLCIDLRLNPAAISVDILDSLSLLEPFGAENPSPVFGLFGMTLTGVKSIGGDKHIRLTLSKDGCNIPAVYFGQTSDSFPYVKGDKVDLAVKIEKNDFRGEKQVSIQIKDIRPASENDYEMFRSLYIYGKFLNRESLSDGEKRLLCPDRALLGSVYRYSKEHKIKCDSAEILCMRLACPYENAGKVNICLDVLENVGILKKEQNGYALTDFSGKANLADCEILKNLGYGKGE